MTTFVYLEHFVVLKSVVAHYRVLASKEVIQTSFDLSNHLYTINVWTERLELINIIFQRFLRVYFILLIDEKTHFFSRSS